MTIDVLLRHQYSGTVSTMNDTLRDQVTKLYQDKNDGEPALRAGAVTAFVAAVLALLVAFGLDLSETQTGAILTVVTLAAPIFAAVWTRVKAWSPKSTFKLANELAQRPSEPSLRAVVASDPR